MKLWEETYLCILILNTINNWEGKVVKSNKDEEFRFKMRQRLEEKKKH
jgi:hypothetical protein